MRISSGVRTPARSLGRRDVSFGLQRLFLPSAVLDVTLLFLRQAGAHGDERFLVWAGSILAGEGVVSTVVMPRAASGPLHGEIPPEVNAHVFDALDSRDLVPLAQIHSHPRGPGMSSIDRERPLVAVAGFLSIIVPDFGYVDPDAVTAWGVYRYQAPRRWLELSAREKVETIVIDDSVLRIE